MPGQGSLGILAAGSLLGRSTNDEICDTLRKQSLERAAKEQPRVNRAEYDSLAIHRRELADKISFHAHLVAVLTGEKSKIVERLEVRRAAHKHVSQIHNDGGRAAETAFNLEQKIVHDEKELADVDFRLQLNQGKQRQAEKRLKEFDDTEGDNLRSAAALYNAINGDARYPVTAPPARAAAVDPAEKAIHHGLDF
jgi:hypothetical protein